MHLFLGSDPRTLFLVTSTLEESKGRPPRALVFRAANRDTSVNANAATQALVEFLPKNQVNLANAVRLTSRIVKGCLGLISIESGEWLSRAVACCAITEVVSTDIFLAVITSATEIGNTRPSATSTESVAKIHEVSFYSLTSSTWDDLASAGDIAPSPDTADLMLRGAGPSPDPYSSYQQSSSLNANGSQPVVFEHPCLPLTKILGSGNFYYALEPQWDLSTRLGLRLDVGNTERGLSGKRDIGAFDERFVWNEYIVRSLLDFRERLDAHERLDLDRCQFIVSHFRCPFSSGLDPSIQILTIQGYVGVSTMTLASPPTDGSPTIATLSLISRLGWKRAGTRFNTRGVDDDGNTANFVEVNAFTQSDSLLKSDATSTID